MTHYSSRGDIPHVGEHIHVGRPLAELPLPRVQGWQGYHHEKGSRKKIVMSYEVVDV